MAKIASEEGGVAMVVAAAMAMAAVAKAAREVVIWLVAAAT